LEVPDADGVPLGWQSGPQLVLDEDVVLEPAGLALDEALVVVLEAPAPAAVVDGGATVVVDVRVVTGEVLEVEVADDVDVPVPADVAVAAPPLPPQPATTVTTATSAASIRNERRIEARTARVTAGPRALRARV
jgi:hypothetical protein